GLATGHDIGRNIPQHNTAAGTHGIGANLAKLMHQGSAAEHHIVTHMDMAPQGGVVGHNQVIAQDTVMGNVHVGHQQVVAADPGFTLILHRATVDGATLADDVVVTNDQTGRLSLVLLILTFLSNTGELEDLVVAADRGRALDHHMGVDHRSWANLHIIPDIGPGSDFNIFGNPC